MGKDTRNYYERELEQINCNGEHPARIILIGSEGRTTRTLDINKESAVALIHKLTAFLITPERTNPQSPLRVVAKEQAADPPPTDPTARGRTTESTNRDRRPARVVKTTNRRIER
jgi:hypothetical protein